MLIHFPMKDCSAPPPPKLEQETDLKYSLEMETMIVRFFHSPFLVELVNIAQICPHSRVQEFGVIIP